MNINQIQKERKDILYNLNPYEMEAYIKILINRLYESFLEQDLEKALASKKLIEEATELFNSKGYINCFTKELEFRLAKANEVLIETLESKGKAEANLSEVIAENIFSNNIELVNYSNSILNILVGAYYKEPSENLLGIIKAVAKRIELELTIIKYLLEDKDFISNEDHIEEVEILKESYSTFEDITRKINSF